jgi:hypothetical protein
VVPLGEDEVPLTVVAPAVRLPCASVDITGTAVKQFTVNVAALLIHRPDLYARTLITSPVWNTVLEKL